MGNTTERPRLTGVRAEAALNEANERLEAAIKGRDNGQSEYEAALQHKKTIMEWTGQSDSAFGDVLANVADPLAQTPQTGVPDERGRTQDTQADEVEAGQANVPPIQTKTGLDSAVIKSNLPTGAGAAAPGTPVDEETQKGVKADLKKADSDIDKLKKQEGKQGNGNQGNGNNP